MKLILIQRPDTDRLTVLTDAHDWTGYFLSGSQQQGKRPTLTIVLVLAVIKHWPVLLLLRASRPLSQSR